MIKIKAYDKYQEKNIEIILNRDRFDDDVNLDWFSSNEAGGKISITVTGGEDPSFSRWSDLENLTLEHTK